MAVSEIPSSRRILILSRSSQLPRVWVTVLRSHLLRATRHASLPPTGRTRRPQAASLACDHRQRRPLHQRLTLGDVGRLLGDDPDRGAHLLLRVLGGYEEA